MGFGSTADDKLRVRDYQTLDIGRVYYSENMWFMWNGYILAYRLVIDIGWNIMSREDITNHWGRVLIPTDTILDIAQI